jgi:hypothetical protein
MIVTLAAGRGASRVVSVLASACGASILGSTLGASGFGDVSSWSGAMAGDSVMTGSIPVSEALTEPESALIGWGCCSLKVEVSRID